MSIRRTIGVLSVFALAACSGGLTSFPKASGSATSGSTSGATTSDTLVFAPAGSGPSVEKIKNALAHLDRRFVNNSALRVPTAVLAASRKSGRTLDALGATAYPISALAYPISALAYPISALAYAGQAAPTTFMPCPPSAGAGCRAQINTSIALNPNPYANPNQISGIQPLLLRALYNVLGSNGGQNRTIGVVVAYDNPNLASDLAIYRKTFGLPPCTVGNGCLTKMNESGSTAQSSLPPANANWSIESSLDVDAISALCSACNIMVVEANTNNIPDLGAAVNTAVASGANVVSNSYGVPEASDNVQYAADYEHPGVAITAAGGDLGYGPQFPASVPGVTAVGGTSIQQIDTNGAIQETVWAGTGAGCSAYFTKPSYQTDTGCSNRTANDIAFLADPNDGIAVYDSTLPNTPQGGWTVIGGTSLGAPAIAALIAMEGSNQNLASNASIYANEASNPNALLGILTGSDGTCAVSYLCNGGTGYNGPSGVGVPFGNTALAPSASPISVTASPWNNGYGYGNG